MAGPAWRVEFDRGAARELRKLGTEAERRVLSFLRTRVAGSADPRRFGQPLTGDRQGFWRYRVGDCRIVAAIEDGRFVVLGGEVGQRREVSRLEEAAQSVRCGRVTQDVRQRRQQPVDLPVRAYGDPQIVR